MNRILVALDTSPRAPHVLETAIELARQTGARLSLFRAVTIPPELPLERYMNAPGDLGEMLLADAKKELTSLGESVPPSHFEGTHARIAAPWEGICAAAKETGARVIVIGAHGYGTLDRLLGTTASKVVNHATCSVFVVR